MRQADGQLAVRGRLLQQLVRLGLENRDGVLRRGEACRRLVQVGQLDDRAGELGRVATLGTRALVAAARERARASGHAWDDASPAPAAAVGAAFACVRTANDLAASTGRSLSDLLDDAFSQLGAVVSAPAGPPA